VVGVGDAAREAGEQGAYPRGNTTEEQWFLAGTLSVAFDVDPKVTADMPSCVTTDVHIVTQQRDLGSTLRPVWGFDKERWRLLPESFCEIAELLEVSC